MDDYLNDLKNMIKSEVLKRLKSEELGTLYPLMNDYFHRGGKLFRPLLCMIGCELFNGDVNKTIPTACALEFFHNFALIHDDIEDKSLLRRGSKCLHKIHGIPLSVNAGDGLFVRTYEVLLENEELLGKEKCLKILNYFTNGVVKTIEGQAMDIGWVEKEDYNVSVKDYLKMAGKKTGVYTGKMPLALGALIACAGSEEVKKIEEFGSRMAIAFQIRDDLLNLIGSEEEYGKEIGGDLNEGKRSLIIIHYLEHAGESEKEWMKKVLKENDNKPSVLKEAIKKLKTAGSIEFAQKKGEGLVKESLTYLKEFPESRVKNFLEELANKAIHRRK